jgi:SAM-dependent methyltransferase
MTYRFVSRSACPGCASQAHDVLADTPMNGGAIAPIVANHYAIDAEVLAAGRFRALRCQACGTIFQGDVGDGDLLGDLYDTWLGAAVGDAYQAEFDWLVAHPRQSRDGHEIMTAAALLGTPTAGLKTLDYGMGQCLWARVALGLGVRSYGFDLSPMRMRIAAEHGVGTIGYDDIAGAGFDLINTEQVMEHVTDVDGVMERLAAGLRRGGVLKISVPAQNAVVDALAAVARGRTPDARTLMPLFPLEHVNAFTVAGLEALGRRFGLRRVAPTLGQRLVFLRHFGSISATNPRNSAKELVRPFMPYEGRENLTIWLQAPTDR